MTIAPRLTGDGEIFTGYVVRLTPSGHAVVRGWTGPSVVGAKFHVAAGLREGDVVAYRVRLNPRAVPIAVRLYRRERRVKGEGVVVEYDRQQGRGVIALDSGERVPFSFRQVVTPPQPWKPRNSNAPVGSGFELVVGDRVDYDSNHAHRPVRPL